MDNGIAFRSRVVAIRAPLTPPGLGRTSQAMPETGSATIKTCRPRSSAGPSRATPSSVSFRRSSKRACSSAYNISPVSPRPAGARAESYGNLGAPHARSKAADPSALSAVQTTPARSSPGGQSRHSQHARHDPATARSAHQLREISKQVFTSRTRPDRRSLPPAASPGRRPASRTTRLDSFRRANEKTTVMSGITRTSSQKLCVGGFQLRTALPPDQRHHPARQKHSSDEQREAVGAVLHLLHRGIPLGYSKYNGRKQREHHRRREMR